MKERSWPILPGLLAGVLAAGGCGTQQDSTRTWVAGHPRPAKFALGAGDAVGYSSFLDYVAHRPGPEGRATRHAAADTGSSAENE